MQGARVGERDDMHPIHLRDPAVSGTTGMAKVRLESVDCFERDFKLRLPFRLRFRFRNGNRSSSPRPRRAGRTDTQKF